MLRPKNIIVYLVLMTLMACAGGNPVPSPWSTLDKFERFQKQIHHWGQKGETRPNKGWADYTYVNFVSDGGHHTIFKQNNRNLSITVLEKEGHKIRFQAVSLPDAGYFYKSNKPLNCKPDSIETMGLLLEIRLFLLAQTFPAGPASVTKSLEASAKGNPMEIRFMQGAMRYRNYWESKTHLDFIKPQHFHVDVYFDNKNYGSFEWDSNRTGKVIPDEESLEGWEPCWLGETNLETGETVFELPNHKDLKTFGEVRAAIKANQSE